MADVATNKDALIRLRVSTAEKEAIEAQAESHGLTVSAYIRSALLGAVVKAEPAESQPPPKPVLDPVTARFKELKAQGMTGGEATVQMRKEGLT